MASSEVLYVEDDDSTRYSVTRLLEKSGFLVRAAAGGREALQLLEAGTNLPQVIVLDLMLPDLSGVQLLRHAQADPRWREIPVVVVTGTLWPGEKLREFTVAEVIYKPFAPEQLVVTLEAICRPPGTE